MKIINQNEYNLYLEVVFSNTVLFKRAISMVALLFISNLNIIFSKDIDKNNSINYVGIPIYNPLMAILLEHCSIGI